MSSHTGWFLNTWVQRQDAKATRMEVPVGLARLGYGLRIVVASTGCAHPIHGGCAHPTRESTNQSCFKYSSKASFSINVKPVPNSCPQRLLPELRCVQSVVWYVKLNLVCI